MTAVPVRPSSVSSRAWLTSDDCDLDEFRAVTISPAISASHHAVVVLCSVTPSLERTTIAVANVYAPIVASVSGGCSG